MEQKTVEQIAHDHAMKADAGQQETAKYSFIDGYTTAQQSQPMWREIEVDREYYGCAVKKGVEQVKIFMWDISGDYLLNLGYTHYLSSEDLLKLPTEKK